MPIFMPFTPAYSTSNIPIIVNMDHIITMSPERNLVFPEPPFVTRLCMSDGTYLIVKESPGDFLQPIVPKAAQG